MSQDAVKLLKIDDKSLVSDLDKAGYRKMGVIVKAVHSEREAYAALKKDSYDVILINLDYPNVNAMSFCQRLKNDPKYSDLHVIITSVNAKVKNQQEALSAGASLFIEQPFPRPFLVEKIKKMLELKTRDEQRIAGDAKLVIKRQGSVLPCVLADLSSSGILVYLEDGIKLGEAVAIELSLPMVKKTLRIAGEVVRQVDSSKSVTASGDELVGGIGMGIKFVSMSTADRNELEKYVHINNSKDLNMIYYL